ncbi:hypothetical protein [Clostridium botulinum]|uniref:hypothetical protein n=1 Tax=Clostridium botulinum TaxID=1491 RepID=UPI001E30EFA8|nr:hypothetical protein [Clostridium botulinum]MCD3254347.1 hypothetical protein [Clostridium botulinum C/D]MCD3279847.1 hypothetical protein [Clostridium botulinum C/D]MCD3339578.1 hypothetical protein [Clostridium botulinum C/D]MCD3357486.1 hypothetical protein [Clostridium botulinum C/D]
MPLHKIPLCSFNYVGDIPLGVGNFTYNYSFDIDITKPKFLSVDKNKKININTSNFSTEKENDINIENNYLLEKHLHQINKENITNGFNNKNIDININTNKSFKSDRHIEFTKDTNISLQRDNTHYVSIIKPKYLTRNIIGYSLLKEFNTKCLSLNRKININKDKFKYLKGRNNIKLLNKITYAKLVDIRYKLDMLQNNDTFVLDSHRNIEGNINNCICIVERLNHKDCLINSNNFIDINKHKDILRYNSNIATIRNNKHGLSIKKSISVNKHTDNNISKTSNKFTNRNTEHDFMKNSKSLSITKNYKIDINKNNSNKLLQHTTIFNMLKDNNRLLEKTSIRNLFKENNIRLKKYTRINISKDSSFKLLLFNKNINIFKDNYNKLLNKNCKHNIDEIKSNKSLIKNSKTNIDKSNFDLFLDKNNYINIDKSKNKFLDKQNSINIDKINIKKFLDKEEANNIFKYNNLCFGFSKDSMQIFKDNVHSLNKSNLTPIYKDNIYGLNKYSKDIKIERIKNKLLEVAKRWWILEPTLPTDKKILPTDYNYLKNPLEVIDAVTNRYKLINHHPISFNPYLEELKGTDLNWGLNEIDLSIEIMLEMVNIVGMIIHHSASQFVSCSGQEAMGFVMQLILDWFNLDSTKEQMLHKGSYEHYLRCYRWIRWEAEKVWFMADKDKSIRHGLHYAGMLFAELIDYMKYHHFNIVPIHKNLKCMDIIRNFNRQATNKDLIKELDKIKGYRHYSIDNQII